MEMAHRGRKRGTRVNLAYAMARMVHRDCEEEWALRAKQEPSRMITQHMWDGHVTDARRRLDTHEGDILVELVDAAIFWRLVDPSDDDFGDAATRLEAAVDAAEDLWEGAE